MVLRQDGGGVLCIGQASHAWLSGQLAAAWGNSTFGTVAPYAEVVLAAVQHDVGMAEWDLAPRLNASTGWPRSFMEMPLELHLSLWSRAASRVLSQSAYAALLVSMHGVALYARRDLGALGCDERAHVEQFLVGQRELQAGLIESLGLDADEVARNQRLLWTWDSLSLALCVPWRKLSLERVPVAGGGSVDVDVVVSAESDTRFVLSPWPFGDGTAELEVRCEARRLERRFGDEAALHAALARAPLETLRFTLSPGA